MLTLSKKLNNIPFMLSLEPEVISEIICKLPPSPSILEIGTFRGLSAIMMAKARPDVTVLTIDPHIGIESSNLTSSYEEVISNLKKAQVQDRVKHFPISSKDFVPSSPVDILFIDGDHSFAGVSFDYHKFKPFVKKGGFIIFHDYHLKSIKTLCDSIIPGKGKCFTFKSLFILKNAT